MTYFVVQAKFVRHAQQQEASEPLNNISQTIKFRPFAIRFSYLNHTIPSLPLLTHPSSPAKPESAVLLKFAHTHSLRYASCGRCLVTSIITISCQAKNDFSSSQHGLKNN